MKHFFTGLFILFGFSLFADDVYPAGEDPSKWTDAKLFVHPRPDSVHKMAYDTRKKKTGHTEKADKIAAMSDEEIKACIPVQSPLIHHYCPNTTLKNGKYTSKNDPKEAVFDPAKPKQYTCKECGEVFPNNPKYPINLTNKFYAPKLTKDAPLGKMYEAKYYIDDQKRKYCFDGILDTARDKWCQGAMRELMRAYYNTKDEKYARKLAVFVDEYAQRFRDWLLVKSYGQDYKDAKGREFPYGWTDTRYGRRASGEQGGPGNMLRATDICWDSQAFKDYGKKVGRDIKQEALQTMKYAKARYGGGFGKFHQGFPATDRFGYGQITNDREIFRAFAQCVEKMPQISFSVDGGYTEGPGYSSIHLWRADENLRKLNGYSDPEGYKVPADSYNTKAWKKMFPQGDVPYQGLLKDYKYPTGKYEEFWKKAFTWTKKIGSPAGPPPIFNDASYGGVTRAAFLRQSPLKRSGNVMLPGFRHVMLGDGEGDDQVQVHMGFGISTNHGHQDTLDLQFFGKGHYLLDDYSYPKHNLRLTYSGAMGHNVVMVNNENQRDGMGDGNPLFYEPNLPGLSAVRIDSPRVYAGLAKRYARTLVLNSVDIKHPYIIDLFVVDGGKTRDYFMRGGKIHGINKQTSNLKTEPVAGVRPLLPENIEWDDKYVDVLGDGYGVLFNVLKTAAPEYFYVDYEVQDPWKPVKRKIGGKRSKETVDITGKTAWGELPYKAGDDSWADKPKVGLRHHFAVEKDYTAYLLEMPISASMGGKDYKDADGKLLPSEKWPRQPGFMLRHAGEGKTAVFVAVHEPYAGKPVIESVKRLPQPLNQPNGVGLQIKFTNGRTDTVFLSTDEKPTAFNIAGIKFNGLIGSVSRQRGKIDKYLIGGTELSVSDDNNKLTQPAGSYTGTVTKSQRTWNGDKANGFLVDSKQKLPKSLAGSWIILSSDGEMVNAKEGQHRYGQGSLSGQRTSFLKYKLKFVRREIEKKFRDQGITKPYEWIEAEALKSPLGKRLIELRKQIADTEPLLTKTRTTWTAQIKAIEERNGKQFIITTEDHGLEIDGDKCHEYFFPQRWLEGSPVNFAVYPGIANVGKVQASPAGGEFMQPVTAELKSTAQASNVKIEYALIPIYGNTLEELKPDPDVIDSPGGKIISTRKKPEDKHEIKWQTYSKPVKVTKDARLVARSITPNAFKTPLYQTFTFRIAKTPEAINEKELAPVPHLAKFAVGFTRNDPKKNKPPKDALVPASNLYQSMKKGPAVYQGYLKVPKDGIYTFHYRTIGDGRIFLGGVEILSYRNIAKDPMPRTVKVPLKKGFYPIVLDSKRGIYELEWEGSGIKRRNFKPSELWHRGK